CETRKANAHEGIARPGPEKSTGRSKDGLRWVMSTSPSCSKPRRNTQSCSSSLCQSVAIRSHRCGVSWPDLHHAMKLQTHAEPNGLLEFFPNSDTLPKARESVNFASVKSHGFIVMYVTN